MAEVELTRLLAALAMTRLMQAQELTTLLVVLVMISLIQALERHTSLVTMAKYKWHPVHPSLNKSVLPARLVAMTPSMPRQEPIIFLEEQVMIKSMAAETTWLSVIMA